MNVGFQMLSDGLQKMATKISLTKYKTPNKITMVKDICNSLSKCAEKVLDIETAAAIVTLMKTLSEFVDNDVTVVKSVISELHSFTLKLSSVIILLFNICCMFHVNLAALSSVQ